MNSIVRHRTSGRQQVKWEFERSDPALARRTAIVTGASQGLGREITLHSLAAGADVAICARSTEDLARTATALRQLHPNRKILAAACDIACSSDVDQLFDAAEAQFGSVDIIVNNAGVHGPIGPIDAVDWREWQRAIAVNLNGTAYSCRKAVQHFKSRTNATRRAKIINLSGGGAHCSTTRSYRLWCLQGGFGALHRNAGGGSERFRH